mmetsp:Transcript_42018/g.65690  ORF Transcript_42018/g.65690 Transcript_42018/m.65690 type:complete len:104 (-) Transcript_42018:808-1119(-)
MQASVNFTRALVTWDTEESGFTVGHRQPGPKRLVSRIREKLDANLRAEQQEQWKPQSSGRGITMFNWKVKVAQVPLQNEFMHAPRLASSQPARTRPIGSNRDQ